jgi:formiminotetrahydrofolate cyclodeaminase
MPRAARRRRWSRATFDALLSDDHAVTKLASLARLRTERASAPPAPGSGARGGLAGAVTVALALALAFA